MAGFLILYYNPFEKETISTLLLPFFCADLNNPSQNQVAFLNVDINLISRTDPKGFKYLPRDSNLTVRSKT
jgi:hypothetical protein